MKIRGIKNNICLISSYKCTFLKIKIKIIDKKESKSVLKIIVFFCSKTFFFQKKELKLNQSE